MWVISQVHSFYYRCGIVNDDLPSVRIFLGRAAEFFKVEIHITNLLFEFQQFQNSTFCSVKPRGVLSQFVVMDSRKLINTVQTPSFYFQFYKDNTHQKTRCSMSSTAVVHIMISPTLDFINRRWNQFGRKHSLMHNLIMDAWRHVV